LAFEWRRLNGCLEFEDLIGVGVGRRRVGVYVISSIEPMYPYYRAGLCLCGVFRLCLLWPVAIAALWSAGGDICGVYGIYSVDI